MKSPDHSHDVTVADPVADRATLGAHPRQPGARHQPCPVRAQAAGVSLSLARAELRLWRTRHHARRRQRRRRTAAARRRRARTNPAAPPDTRRRQRHGRRLLRLCRPGAELFSVFLLDGHVTGRRRRAASGGELSPIPSFQEAKLGTALATHFTAGNIGTAVIPLCAAILISVWGWRGTVILFAIPAILVGLAMSHLA